MVDVSYGQPTLRISSQKIGGSRWKKKFMN
jgi:hypothetical protein